MSRTLGNGTTIHWDYDGGTTWVSLGCVNEVSLPEVARERVDVTCLSDTQEKFELGITKAPEFTFTITDSDASLIDDLADANQNKNESAWKVTEPQTSPVVFTFNGYVEEVKRVPQKNNEPLRTQVKVITTSVMSIP